jgi:hypothetical protein
MFNVNAAEFLPGGRWYVRYIPKGMIPVLVAESLRSVTAGIKYDSSGSD